MIIVKTKTSDGLFLRGLLTRSNTSKKLIIHIHGMAGSPLLNDYYPLMHDGYARVGISFLAVENRGTGMITYFDSDGGSRTVGNALERFEDSVFDIQGWIDYAKNEGFEEIWLQSHSLGTSKVAYYVSTVKSNEVKGLILLSPSDMVGLVHDPVGSKDNDIMLPQAKELVSEGKGHQLIDHKLWGEELLSADTYLNFFDEGTKTAIFNYADEKLGWDVVRSIYLPVLAITGTKDDGVVSVSDPYLAMEKLKKELISSPKVMTVVFEGATHGFDGFGDKIVEEAIRFIG